MAYERKFKIGKPILEVNNISLTFGGVKALTPPKVSEILFLSLIHI